MNGSEELRTVQLTVDGTERTVAVRPGETLLETLRERFRRTSVRQTCGIGVCGSCTVLLDGKVISSCIKLTELANGHTITTAEGLGGPDGQLSPVQEAFVSRAAYQCSFCIPAMTVAVHAAMADPEVRTSTERVREYLAGNLCRCGSYPQILQAVDDLVKSQASQGLEADGDR